ncbi:flagellar basal body P-ring formation protein FlgA [Trinickia dabaoshanensis]|uniref:Flagellar basal body P-ring formation protein FlgA n=1 Tax=Trinickia dabaoshanensis TaxID=564714 RepID=A0A2N7VZY1_9BURK|nr:flagellar basal body P-ring formation chaperone FlgA [Trinickia dabaoshanensis]PMS22722.1 flagellar basal body P-ring formation protein FlgA [Trinickia dabaoshanensis]
MSVSAVSDPARRHGPRALGRRHARLARAAAGLLLTAAALAPFGGAHAQSAGASASASGQIYIPGPGETHASAPSGTMISIPGPGESRGAAPAGAAPAGMIVIPGPGETASASAAGAGQSQSAVVNIPSRASIQPRPVAVPAVNRPMPVVVTAPQRTVRGVQPIAMEQPAARLNAAAASAPAGAQVSPATPVAAAVAPASNAPAGQEDGETIRRAALAFLQQQTLGLPGKITITVAPSFPRGLAACATLEPFMPTGARLWGTTSVGVRCAGAKPWTLYLQARIAIEATYYLAAHQIEPGTLITPQDLLARNGDLSNLPRAIVTDPSQAVGSTAITRIGAGVPLRQDLLKSASAVTIGQTVKVVAQGQGFSISSEGSVMNNASPGQQVRVKMAGGQIISGTVVDGATVQVQM